MSMRTYDVEVARSISVTVPVRARSAAEAIEKAGQTGFPLPPRDEWAGGKDWSYVAYGPGGRRLAEFDSRYDS